MCYGLQVVIIIGMLGLPRRKLLFPSNALRWLASLPLVLAAAVGCAQSSRPGMGSIPYADAAGTGVTFRVWAPNATTVYVPGSFNAWNTLATPLISEGQSGLWSADVPQASAGDQYKYHINGSVWKRDPRGRKVVHSADNTIIYDPNAFDWMGDTRLSVNASDLVIYEMHIGAFYDPPGGGSPGMFTDAIAKLDHLAGLGVNAVELLPIMEFAGDYSWGYDLAEPFAVENLAYGGADGLKNFVRAAHERGIHVFLDIVHNHYGPSDLDLWGFDDGSAPGIYFYSGDGICCTPWGSRPDYSSEGVRSYIIDSFRMWMDECHIDGFRWDAVGAMRHYDPGYASIPEADSLIQYINSTTIHSERPGVFSIAEDDSYGMGFDGEWDHGFAANLINQVTQANDADRNMNALGSAMGGSSLFNVLFAETHDLVGDLNGAGNQRLPKRIDSSNPASYWARKRSMLAAAVLMTTPGIPMLFMGQEMLEAEQFSDSNPLDWTHATTFPGVVNFYRDLIHLRRNLDNVSLGLTGPNLNMHVQRNDAPWKLLAFHRWGAGADDQVMVVMNFTANSIPSYVFSGWPADGTWYVNLNSDWMTYGSDFGNQGSSVVTVTGGSGEVAVGPYSVLILSRQAHPELDADKDGLLNGWEEEHFGDPLIAEPAADNDHDNADNTNEQGADTDPKVRDSVLQLLSASLNGGSLTLEWKGGVNARQVVQTATSLSESWTDIFTNEPPTAITNSLSITAPESQSYFRIKAGL